MYIYVCICIYVQPTLYIVPMFVLAVGRNHQMLVNAETSLCNWGTIQICGIDFIFSFTAIRQGGAWASQHHVIFCLGDMENTSRATQFCVCHINIASYV